MRPFHVEALRCNHQLLELQLQLGGTNMLPDLLNSRVITPAQANHVQQQPNREFQNKVLLAYLIRCPYDLNPFQVFLQALQVSHGSLYKAVWNTFKDKETYNRLHYLRQAWICERCILLRYLDPATAGTALTRAGLLGTALHRQLQGYVHKSLQFQVETLLSFLLMEGGTCSDPEGFAAVMTRLAALFKNRGSTELCNRLRALRTPSQLTVCRCSCEVSESDRDALRQRALTLRAQAPAKAHGGDEGTINLLSYISSELVSILTFGRWNEYETYSDGLRVAFPHLSHDIEALIASHGVLLKYCQGRPLEGFEFLPAFKEHVEKSSSPMFLRLSCEAIMAGVYRATKETGQAVDSVTGALQCACGILPNKSIAYLHERYGVSILHARDPDTNEIPQPSQKTLDEAATAMHEAFVYYRRSSEEAGKAMYEPGVNRQYVNDHSAWMLYEIKFWPLIEFTATKLGTCIAGHYVHPDPVPEAHWQEVDKAIGYIAINEDLLSPSRKCRSFMLNSDYHLRKSETRMTLEDMRSDLEQAGLYAEKASQLRKEKNLKIAIETMVERRRKRLECRKKTLVKVQTSALDERKLDESGLSFPSSNADSQSELSDMGRGNMNALKDNSGLVTSVEEPCLDEPLSSSGGLLPSSQQDVGQNHRYIPGGSRNLTSSTYAKEVRVLADPEGGIIRCPMRIHHRNARSAREHASYACSSDSDETTPKEVMVRGPRGGRHPSGSIEKETVVEKEEDGGISVLDTLMSGSWGQHLLYDVRRAPRVSGISGQYLASLTEAKVLEVILAAPPPPRQPSVIDVAHVGGEEAGVIRSMGSLPTLSFYNSFDRIEAVTSLGFPSDVRNALRAWCVTPLGSKELSLEELSLRLMSNRDEDVIGGLELTVWDVSGATGSMDQGNAKATSPEGLAPFISNLILSLRSDPCSIPLAECPSLGDVQSLWAAVPGAEASASGTGIGRRRRGVMGAIDGASGADPVAGSAHMSQYLAPSGVSGARHGIGWLTQHPERVPQHNGGVTGGESTLEAKRAIAISRRRACDPQVISQTHANPLKSDSNSSSDGFDFRSDFPPPYLLDHKSQGQSEKETHQAGRGGDSSSDPGDRVGGCEALADSAKVSDAMGMSRDSEPYMGAGEDPQRERDIGNNIGIEPLPRQDYDDNASGTSRAGILPGVNQRLEAAVVPVKEGSTEGQIGPGNSSAGNAEGSVLWQCSDLSDLSGDEYSNLELNFQCN